MLCACRDDRIIVVFTLLTIFAADVVVRVLKVHSGAEMERRISDITLFSTLECQNNFCKQEIELRIVSKGARVYGSEIPPPQRSFTSFQVENPPGFDPKIPLLGAPQGRVAGPRLFPNL